MDLNKLNFTRRRFRSESILYNDYLLRFNGIADIDGAGYELLKINENTIVINPSNNIIEPEKILSSMEVAFIPFEYPNPGNKILIAYDPDLNTTGVPCFISFLKNSIHLVGQNINNGGPESRLGITLQRSKSNIWSFGGYQSPNRINSTANSYFFLFNGTSNSWVDKTESAIKANIPNLVYHTMTNINDEYLIIIGGGIYDAQGILVDKSFDKVYKFDLNQETWTTASLINCPTNTRIGHTTTIVNGNLIVIGGTDNQQESKLNIYSDIMSIDPNTLKCTNITIKYENGVSTSIKTAFHATSFIENYLLISYGMRDTNSDQHLLLIDTTTWARKFRFKNLSLLPNPDSYPPSSQSTSNANIIIYSVVGVGILLIFLIFVYYLFIVRKRKKRESNNTRILAYKINNQEPDVEWVKSDSNTFQLDNEAVFVFDDKATTGMKTEADREADLRQLNTLNFVSKNSKSSNQDRIRNNIQEFSETLTNSTLVSKTSFVEDNALTSESVPKN